MGLLNPILTKNFVAEAAVAAYRIVKFGTADKFVTPGAAATDKLVGVATSLAAAINERCDVILSGIAEVEYGGTVARGDLLTSDASGRAITAAPGVGVNNRIIGVAMESGAVGEIGSVNLCPCSLQG